MPRHKSLVTIIRDLVRDEVGAALASLIGVGGNGRKRGRKRVKRKKAGANGRRRRRREPGRPPAKNKP